MTTTSATIITVTTTATFNRNRNSSSGCRRPLLLFQLQLLLICSNTIPYLLRLKPLPCCVYVIKPKLLNVFLIKGSASKSHSTKQSGQVLEGFDRHFQAFAHFPLTRAVNIALHHHNKFLEMLIIEPWLLGLKRVCYFYLWEPSPKSKADLCSRTMNRSV